MHVSAGGTGYESSAVAMSLFYNLASGVAHTLCLAARDKTGSVRTVARRKLGADQNTCAYALARHSTPALIGFNWQNRQHAKHAMMGHFHP